MCLRHTLIIDSLTRYRVAGKVTALSSPEPGFLWMTITLDSAISAFGAQAKEKLSNPAATGQPEDQLRAPLERLLKDLAKLCRLPGELSPVGESSVRDLKTRPDYAIIVDKALVGFIEIKERRAVRPLGRASTQAETRVPAPHSQQRRPVA